MAVTSGYSLQDLVKMGPSAIERQMALAEALRQQAAGDGQVDSPTEGLAMMANALFAGLGQRKADRAALSGKEGAGRRMADIAAALSGNGAFPNAPGAQTAGATTAPTQRPPVDPNVGSTIDFARAKPQASGGGAIREGLIARGMPEHIADAFMLNFQDESGLNSDINEAKPLVPGSRGGYGLYQLTGPRRTGFEAFAAKQGKDPSDVDAQLDWLMYELQGPEATAAKNIFAAKDTPTAAAAIVNDFLRPSPEHAASRSARYLRGEGRVPPAVGAVNAMAALPAPEMAGGVPVGAGVPPQAQMAQALIGGQPTADTGMPDMAGNAGPIDTTNGPSIQQLFEAGGNEYLNPGQRGLIEALLGQKLKGPEKPEFITGRDGSIFRGNPDGTLTQVYGGKPDQPADVQEYEYYADRERKAGREPLGPLEYQQALRKSGANSTEVNIDQKAEGQFRKELATQQAKTYTDMANDGLNANADIAIIDELGSLLQGQGGAMTGLKAWAAQKGIDVGEATDDLQAASALINKLVPTQRQAGSGSMSDRDVELFKSSLPSLWNQPGGNLKILQVMRGMAEYRKAQGDIAAKVVQEELTPQEARKLLQALPNPLAGIRKGGAPATAPVAPVTTPDGYTIEPLDE